MKRLFALILSLLAVPAFAADSGEIPVSPLIIGSASTPAARRNVKAASGPDGHIVVWEERGNVPTIAIRTYELDGRPRQQAAITIAEGTNPAVTWTPAGFVVGWVGVDIALHTARVDADGGVTQRSRFTNTAVPPLELSYHNDYLLVLVAGMVRRAGENVLQLGVTPSGMTPVDVAEGTIAGRRTTTGELIVSTLMANGTSLPPRTIAPSVNTLVVAPGVVVWTDAAGVHATFNNEALEGPSFLLSSAVVLGTPDVAALGGGAYIAAWHTTGGGTPMICTNRFTISGAGTSQCQNASPRQQQVAVTGHGGSTLLAWTEPGEIDQIRVSIGTGATQIASESAQAQSEPQLALHQFGALLVWTEYNAATQRTQIRIGGVAPDGTQLVARTLAASANPQHTPRVAIGNDGIYIVWLESIDGDLQLFGVQLDRRAANPVPMAYGKAAAPSVASNGTSFIIVAQSHRFGEPVASQILAWAAGSTTSTKISPTGDVQLDPDVVWSGTNFVIAWREVLGIGANARQRVRAASLLGAAVTVTEYRGTVSAPSLAVNGELVAVAWSEEHLEAEDAVHAALLTRAGGLSRGPFLLGTADGRVRVHAADGSTFVAAVASGSSIELHRFNTDLIGTWSLPIAATQLDFGYVGSRLALMYARAMQPEEDLGNTTRAFVRTIDNQPRRRSVR